MTFFKTALLNQIRILRMKENFFAYGKLETDYLKSKDRRLAKVIEKVGHINRTCDSDLFSSVVHHIIGQQISTKALTTIWQRLNDKFKTVSPKTIGAASNEELQSLGMSFRKVSYIKDFCEKINTGEFNLRAVKKMNDADAINALVSLKGVGVWTAEMILLFCLQRPNIFSYGDFEILRGLRILFRHEEISKELFEKYRKKFSPYCSVASLYLWEVAGGKVAT